MTHRPTDLLSLPEAAEALGLSASTLRTQILADRISGSKIGRDWVLTRGEVERYRVQSKGKRSPGKGPT